MIAGLFLNLLGYRFALIFNSAFRRPKTWLTSFLIARMDALIATSEMAAQYLSRPATVIHHASDGDPFPASRPGAAFAESGRTDDTRSENLAGCGGRRASTCSSRRVPACAAIPDFSGGGHVGLTTVDNRPFVEGLKQQVAAAGLTERVRFLGELPVEEVPLWSNTLN